MIRIAIIGAGMAGLRLAQQLQPYADVHVFEKSQGYGGRMATRFSGGYQFDHGAQFFIAKTPAFKTYVDSLITAGVVDIWRARFVELDKSKVTYEWTWTDEVPHYVACPGMNALGEYMAKDLNVSLQTQIKEIKKSTSQWELIDASGTHHGLYDWLILAIPAAQANSLLPGNIPFSNELASKKMIGCYSLMLGFDQELALNWDAALVKEMDISWVCNNGNKPGRPDDYALLAHATNSWAQDNLGMQDDEVKAYLTDQLEQITQRTLDHAKHSSIHRWHYANIEKQSGPQSYVDTDQQLAAIGDWCIKGRIESAFQSAEDAALKILPLLN